MQPLEKDSVLMACHIRGIGILGKLRDAPNKLNFELASKLEMLGAECVEHLVA